MFPLNAHAAGRSLALAAAVCADLSVFTALGRGGGGGGGSAGLWAGAVLRGLVLLTLARLTGAAARPALVRFAAVHCLVAPVLQSGRDLLRGGAAGSGLDWGDVRTWATCAAASVAGCLFWELSTAAGGAGEEEQEEKRRAELFARVLRMYKPDVVLLLGAFSFLLFSVLCGMSIPFYTGKVIDSLRTGYHEQEFLSAIIFIGVYSLGSSLSAGCRGGLFMCVIGSFARRVKLRLFGVLAKQEIGFFEANKTGELTTRLAEDTARMGRTVALNINVLLRTLILTLGVVSLMLSLSWSLTLLVLLETPVAALIERLYNTYNQRILEKLRDSVARANAAANEAVSGVWLVRSFHAERGEARRYDDRLMDTHHLKTRRDTARAVYLLARRLSGLAMQLAVLTYGRLVVQRGHMTTGSLLTFILYQGDLGDNIRTLIYIFGDMMTSVGAAKKVFEYLDRKPKCTMGTLAPDQLKGHVTFDRLTFSYPSLPDHQVLQNFSLDLRPGEVTALVGLSGGGKTTCANLLQSLYQPQHGQILLDGQPLSSYQHHYFHRKVTLVSQEPELFSGSIRDNIAYGLPCCSLDDIQEAAHKANAHEFISKLEKGYDTEVGERGGKLSKSEKQRVAIARALVRHPRVLILDEVTSSLDTDSKNKVQQAFSSGLAPTMLVIAHKLETIENADRIVVIDQGRVQEQGSHQELMEAKGKYYTLREKLFSDTPAASPP
ncbi:Antigen peptide transporter 2 [Merluccius polli]|uniref:Antigen peptide transporter 2 n=1 Tax=Merluccius polli TaxID=89951 RepID=A0AA47MT65_MERPO|nr:Antigen peptide transporter 2 [Merluccius polli]